MAPAMKLLITGVPSFARAPAGNANASEEATPRQPVERQGVDVDTAVRKACAVRRGKFSKSCRRLRTRGVAPRLRQPVTVPFPTRANQSRGWGAKLRIRRWSPDGRAAEEMERGPPRVRGKGPRRRSMTAWMSWCGRHWCISIAAGLLIVMVFGVIPGPDDVLPELARRPDVRTAFTDPMFGKQDAMLFLFSFLFLGPFAGFIGF